MTSVETVADRAEPPDRVRVLRNIEHIDEIADYWRACGRHRDTDVDHYLQEISSSPRTTRPHVLVASRHGRPTALLVGWYEVKRPNLRIGYVRIPTGRIRCLTFPNGALLGDGSAANCKPFIEAIRASLATGEADAAMVHHCDADSPMAALARAHAGSGLLSGPALSSQVHRTRVPLDEQTTGSLGLSTRERQHQRRREKQMRAVPIQARVACFCADRDLDQLMADVETVAGRTYQRGLRIGFTDTPQMRHRLGFAARMGRLRAYVLYIADRPCAFWITGLYRGTLYSDFLGFDPTYARYSPGTYLILNVIDRLGRESANVPVRLIDFGVGEAEYKVRLGNRSVQKVSIFMFAPSVRGVALNALYRTVASLNVGAAGILAGTGLLPRLKRAWRSRLRPG